MLLKNIHGCQVVVAYAFDPSMWETEAVDIWEFEASLVFKASSRTARSVTLRNPVSENRETIHTELGYFVLWSFFYFGV